MPTVQLEGATDPMADELYLMHHLSNISEFAKFNHLNTLDFVG